MISTPTIAWAAGLLEAEGSFLMSGRSVTITLQMVDRDVIERVATVLDGRVYGPVDRSHIKPHHQPIWRAQLKGPGAAGWMMTFYPLLGTRRRGQVARALRDWRVMSYVRISPAAERLLIEAWQAGNHKKLPLARQLGISRDTVYRVLRRHGLEVREPRRRSISPMEIAWLAGLIEGDGNITFNGRSITIRISMTDRDVVLRAAELLDARFYTKKQRVGCRQQWLAQIKGAFAAGWAMTLYPWLGVRRRQQVRDAIAHWREQGNGVVNPGLADVIVRYRGARFSQAEIMRLLKIGKSTVYRHSRRHVPHIRVTKRQEAARAAATPCSVDDP